MNLLLSTRRIRERPLDLFIFALFNVTANVVYGVSPVLVDVLVNDGRATLAQAGRVPTTDCLVMGLVSLVAARVLTLDNIKLKACLAALACAAGNIATMYLTGDAIIAARILAGVGGGVLLWLQYAYIARSRYAELLTGSFLAAYVVASIAILATAQSLIVPRYGANGLFAQILGVCVLTSILALFAPARLGASNHTEGETESVVEKEKSRIPVRAILILASNFLMACAVAGIWVYLDPIAKLVDVSPLWMSRAEVGSLIMQAVGALSAAWLATRVSARKSLVVIGLTMVTACLYIAAGSVSEIGFCAFALIVGWIGCGICPLEVAFLLEVDASRRSVDYFAVPYLLGTGFGPMLSSLLVRGNDIRSGMLTGLLMAAASLLCVVAALKKPATT